MTHDPIAVARSLTKVVNTNPLLPDVDLATDEATRLILERATRTAEAEGGYLDPLVMIQDAVKTAFRWGFAVAEDLHAGDDLEGMWNA